ncbi:unnamed protein product [Cunninghamella blakesleeana]
MSFIYRCKPLILKNSFRPTSLNTYRYYTTETAVAEPKGISGFRSGLTGFFVGISLAGSIGYYYLLEEYNHASESLLTSVRDYAKKIEELEKDLKYLKKNTATYQQLEESRIQLRKLYDTLNMDHLELKTHVWGLEKDLSSLIK